MKLSDMPKNDNTKSTETIQKNINQKFDDLKNLSSDDLMGRLAKEVQAQKNAGVFDYNGLKSSLEKIKTYMPAQTYQNMLNILDSLK